MNLSNIAIPNINGADYCCIINSNWQKWGYKFNAKHWLDWKKQNITKHEKLLSHIKIGKEVLMFGGIEIEKDKFYCYKSFVFQKMHILKMY